MVLKSVGVAAGACALVAGAAIAGSAAHAAPAAASPAAASAAASPAAASPAAGATSAGVAAGRAHRKRCARVPTAILRTQNLEKLLAADASTKGSLAYLQRRIDTAEAAHRTALTAELKNRLTYRRQLATFLPQRLTLLETARTTVCAGTAGTTATS